MLSRNTKLWAECRVSPPFSIYLCCSTNFRICGAGIAPAWRATSRPFRNNVIVGIAETRKRYPKVGTSSVFTFATRSRPAVSLATLRTSGATILHGPHHGAQKSTSTGTAEWLTNASKRGHCEHRQVHQQARVRTDIGRIGKSCPNLRISSDCCARILGSSIRSRGHRVRSF
jgi:hypothetical protein